MGWGRLSLGNRKLRLASFQALVERARTRGARGLGRLLLGRPERRTHGRAGAPDIEFLALVPCAGASDLDDTPYRVVRIESACLLRGNHQRGHCPVAVSGGSVRAPESSGVLLPGAT